MTVKPNGTTQFGGIDNSAANNSDDPVPQWYRDATDAPRGDSVPFDSFMGLMQAHAADYGVEKRPAAYQTDDGTYVEDPRARALVNPSWVGREGTDDCPQATAMWTTVTDSYTPVDSTDAFGPLVAVARREGYADAYGTLYTSRNGGRVAIDVLFDDLRVETPDDDDTDVVLGFTLGHDYFSSASIWGELLAYNTETGTAMRGLSKQFSRTHRGDLDDIQARLVEWFTTMFSKAERLGETLYEVIAEARNHTVDLRDVPLSVEQWYVALGFPDSVARTAAQSVQGQTPTAYELYAPVAAALSNVDVKVGGRAARDHASRANEILFSPGVAERKAVKTAADELRGQATLDADERDAADALMARFETLDDAVDGFRSTREKIRAMLADMSDEVDESDEGEGEADDGADERADSADDGDEGDDPDEVVMTTNLPDSDEDSDEGDDSEAPRDADESASEDAPVDRQAVADIMVEHGVSLYEAERIARGEAEPPSDDDSDEDSDEAEVPA